MRNRSVAHGLMARAALASGAMYGIMCGMKMAIGYVRVSTSDQALDGVSLEAQQAKLKAWANLHDMELAATYSDEGISGKSMDKRPGLIEALDAACKQKAALVVYSLSRLARSTKDAIAISERLEKCGADLVSLTESIDTTTASGKMIFRLFAVLAEFERDTISERTTNAMAHLREQQRRISRYIPYGFDLDEDGKTLVPNEAEQEATALMRQLREMKNSYARIGAELERRGITNKTGKAKWSPTVVRTVLMRTAGSE